MVDVVGFLDKQFDTLDGVNKLYVFVMYHILRGTSNHRIPLAKLHLLLHTFFLSTVPILFTNLQAHCVKNVVILKELTFCNATISWKIKTADLM